MKENIYKIIILILSVTLFISMAFLYSKDGLKNSDIFAKKEHKKAQDILELKEQKRFTNNNFVVKKIENRELNKKLHEVNQMLSKTRTLLKTYNNNSNNIIIKDKDIEQLVNLDIKQPIFKKYSSNETAINLKRVDTEDDKSPTLNNSPNNTEESTNDKVSNLNSTNTNIYSTISSSSNTSSINSTVSGAISSTVNNNSTYSQIQSEAVQSEVSALQTQIDEVKKIITEVSSQVN